MKKQLQIQLYVIVTLNVFRMLPPVVVKSKSGIIMPWLFLLNVWIVNIATIKKPWGFPVMRAPVRQGSGSLKSWQYKIIKCLIEVMQKMLSR
jgi:hypothetical protein